MWISAIVEWSNLTEDGRIKLVQAMVSGDVLDKIAIMESGNKRKKKLLLAIVANKHTYPETLEYLAKHGNAEVRRAVFERKSVH